MISYVMPTRDRPERLRATLAAIDRLGSHERVGGCEVVVVDNDSECPMDLPVRLACGALVHVIRLRENRGAAARNVGVSAAHPASQWIVMLDDDSHPVGTGHLSAIHEADQRTLAISADIHLPRAHTREAGGLPEVFIGCGVAIRRDAFEQAGGYDPAFNYYVEEYDLAARLILMGGRVAFDPRFVVHHHKIDAGRDMNVILHRLVRNNGWVVQRYSPERDRREHLREVRLRYRGIAGKENATRGFARGLIELRDSVRTQKRTPMPRELFDRFTGLAHAREAVARAHDARPFATAALVDPGKNAWAVAQALRERGVELTGEREAEALVVGTMSPGPMLDAALARADDPRLVVPWLDARELVLRSATMASAA